MAECDAAANNAASSDPVRALLTALAGREPIQTHLSEVYVGADTVWKRKKPVQLAFIDLQTTAARRRCLARELERNAANAPGLYRDLVAVVQGADALTLVQPQSGGDPDAVIDWVLRMAPVPAADFLDARAAGGQIDTAMLIALGDMAGELHMSLPPVPEWDSPAALARVIAGNAQAATAAGLPQAAVARWQAGSEAALERLHPWLTARAQQGFVRRAHGDLHLGNITIWQGRVAAFDALEFDEALATIDLAYDLAFLLMDLDRRVDRAAANRVMNRYVARTGDAGLAGGMSLFLSLRAMVRAHVCAQRGTTAEAAAYLQAAEAYLSDAAPSNGTPGLVLAIGGLPGSGKSTIALALAPTLGPAPGAVVIRSDEVRKRLHGVAPEQRLPPTAYVAEANAQTNAALLQMVLQATAGGQAVIADATFLDPTQRAAIRAACAQQGVRFRGVWLEAPLEVLMARVAARQGDASDATEAVLQQAAALNPGPIDWPKLRS